MTDHAPLLERAFELEPDDASYPITRIEGRIPAWVRGDYYVNGPARFRRGGLRYRHWLDGDGMVSRLRLADGGAHLTHRFVRSRKLIDEQAAGRPLYRAFGTAFAGDRLRRGQGLESPVNVSVYPVFGTLLAFGEQGLPWELDPETLETRGEYDFGGRLNAVSPFSAHPHQDSASGELFNFGVSFSASRPALHFYRFDAAGRPVFRRRIPLSMPCSLHDFGLSERHAVFYVNPHVLAIDRLVSGGASVMDALTWEPERGSRLLVARREDGEVVADVAIGSGYCLHQINCFEDGERLVVDVVELEQPIYDQYGVPELFEEARPSSPVRYVLDAAGGRLLERRNLDFHLMADFPAIDPRLGGRAYGRFWMLAISASRRAGRKFFDRVVRLNWRGEPLDSFQAPPGTYLGGEPVLLPHPERREDGLVVCQAFDAERRRSEMLLFAARRLAAGPVARLGLARPVPPGFHACFQPAETSRG